MRRVVSAIVGVSAVLLLAVTFSTPLPAQRSTRVGVAFSTAVPVGLFSQHYAANAGVLGTIAFGANDSPIGLRLDVSDHKVRGRKVDSVQYGNIHITTVTLNMVGTLSGDYIKPYALGGFGWYPFRQTEGAKRHSDWGLNGGLGTTFPLLVGSGFLEARYHRILGRRDIARYTAVSLGFML